MPLTIRPLSRAGGAEVSGVDLARPVPDHDVAQLERALGEHGILLFRGADLTPAQHIAFSRHFGPLESHVVGEFNLADHPEIFVVSNVKEGGKLKGAVYAGQYWHSDLSYMRKPSLGSLLLCHEMPEIGGDTMWANMYLAYETLSEVMKRFLDTLHAVDPALMKRVIVVTGLPPRYLTGIDQRAIGGLLHKPVNVRELCELVAECCARGMESEGRP